MADQGKDIHLWLLRAQYFLAKHLHSKVLASFVLFYLPVMASGYYLSVRYDYDLFTRGILTALVWLGLAPLLVQIALEVTAKFFDDHEHIFASESERLSIRSAELQRLQSPKYLIFGIPWTILTTLIILIKHLPEAAVAIKIWAIVTFALLFIVTSIGFYGVYVLITMMKRLFEADINFNPYHPDKFGGISDFGRYTVKGALLFSSGALIFPLAFEIAAGLGNAADFFTIGLYFCMFFSFVVILASFFIPILEIKRFVDPKKEKLVLATREELDSLIARYRAADTMDAKLAVDIFIKYYLEHLKLYELKDYPFDLKVILELLASFIIPVAIAIMQFVL